ncbi:MAG TPA: response regulator transcription factor [Solirubrobacteraceae bacterium]|nr:response regulator transcription factor [Solirubrobacteraceae bacterium]
MSERVLVCDPDREVQRSLQLILRGAGYEVVCVAGGGDVLERARSDRPQAVVLEVRLPDMDGVELCRRLREGSEMSVVVVSALDDDLVKIDALDAGADDYVTKPFSAGELVSRLGAVRRRAAYAARVEADGVMIDLAGHSVVVDGEDVHLTPTEFSLLRALVTSRGPVGHRALAAKVWGPLESDVEPRLRTHIARLRAKLGENLIRTEIGVGYRFAARHRRMQPGLSIS